MIRISTLSLLFLGLMLFTNIHGRSTDPKCHRSTEGREFWFGFMESRNYHAQHFVEITVTARETTNFQIYTGKNQTPFNGAYTVQANNSLRIQIPWTMVEATGSEQVQDKGIHLVSEKPVNVYALNFDQNSADVAVIYPVESLGNEYFAICYEPHINESNGGNYGNGRNSEFLVVAAADSTRVLIIPSKTTDKLVNAGDTIEVILNKGEVYQVQSMNRNGLPGQGDLTGSYILTSKPAAFYSGSLSTTIPATSNVSAWDHLYEQIPPVYSWGREYYTVPLKSREQDLYRVMAAEDSTVVYIDGLPSFMLNRGKFKEFVLFYNQPKRIYADKPILVVQYSQSQSVDNNYTGGNGDPFMIVLSSTTQSKNDVTFVAYDSNQIKRYFANVITLTEETGNILFNGSSIQNQFTPFDNSNYSWAQLSLSPGTYRLQNTNPDQGFLAYVYGFGGVESYGYGVGFNLDIVLDLGKSIDFDGDTMALCQGSVLKLDAGPYFDRYAWDGGGTTRELTVTRQGKYALTASTVDRCIQRDSIFIVVSDPKTSIGMDTIGCPHTKILKAISNIDIVKYAWTTGETSQSISTRTPGEYSVTAYDKYNCTAKDTLKLDFFDVPSVNITGDQLVCGRLSGALTANISGGNNTWSLKSFDWNSDRPAKVNFPVKTQNSAQYSVAEWGKYNFSYSLTTMNDCIVKDSLLAGIFKIPTSDFEFVDNPGDPCAGYTREILYVGDASSAATLKWDFGGCTADSLDWNRRRVSFPPFGYQPWVTLNVEENGCTSDTTLLAFGANPDFTMVTFKSVACDSDLIRFSGTLNVPDRLDFEWDFGDGLTSMEQFPTHLYNTAGSFDVSLVITNPNTGCRAGFLAEDMVKIFNTPIARFDVDYPVAILEQANLTFDNQTQDGQHYTWDFGDDIFSTDMHPRHTYEKVGEFPVTLIAESGTGCRDTTMMIVKILPFNVFTPNAFRPNSDIPENRVFMPLTLGVDPDQIHLIILNRWGQVIFESGNINYPWDGKLKNGQEAPIGNYVWKADYTDVQGFNHSRKGQVLLIR